MDFKEFALSAVFGAILTALGVAIKHNFEREKIRFELKIDILRELWKAVFELQNSAINLRPQGDFETLTDDVRERRLARHDKAKTACWETIRHNKPFYPESIHDIADRLLMACVIEGSAYAEHADHRDSNYWDESVKAARSIKALADETYQAIRNEVERDF